MRQVRYSFRMLIYLIVVRKDMYVKMSFKREIWQGLLPLQLFVFKTGCCASLTDKQAENVLERTDCQLLGDPAFAKQASLRKQVMEKIIVLIGKGVVHRAGIMSYISPKLAVFSSIAYRDMLHFPINLVSPISLNSFRSNTIPSKLKTLFGGKH